MTEFPRDVDKFIHCPLVIEFAFRFVIYLKDAEKLKQYFRVHVATFHNRFGESKFF